MQKLCKLDIVDNIQIARDTYSLSLFGDCSAFTAPGQFANIALPGRFLRRPLSVCSVRGDLLTLVYKVVGQGTAQLSQMGRGTLDVLTGLGNGFDINSGETSPLLVGGGAGVAPLLGLAEALLGGGKTPSAILGFRSADEIFMAAELSALGVPVSVTTEDGSAGVRGFVTDSMARADTDYDYIFACGPEPMLKAVFDKSPVPGQYSFEARMACGFGACMCCSCETKYGSKRICRDGPVLLGEEVVW